MAYPIYMVPSGDVLPILFDSFDGGTGASITMTGLAVTDIEIYKDGGVTQRASDAGYTLLDTDGIDFDGITGIHGFSIDTGDNTDAGFYTVGAWFHVVVSAITIDAQTVNFIAAAFRLMPAESVAGKPKVDVDAWLGTAAATPTVAGVPEVDLTHVAGATTNVAALATNVDAILTDTADMQPKLGTPAGASISADIAAIEAQTDDIGAAGAGLTAVPWNAAWDAEVQSEVEDALVVHRLDELLNADSDIDGAAPPTVGSVFHELMSKTAGSFTFDQTTDSNEAIRDKETDIETDTAEIGAAGAGLTALASQASVNTIDDFLDTEIAAILEDTGTTIDDLVDDLEGRLTAALATVLQAHSLAVGRVVVGAGSTTTSIVLSTVNGGAPSAVNDFYNGRVIIFTSGGLTLQAVEITDYIGATTTATVSAATSSPAENDTAVIV